MRHLILLLALCLLAYFTWDYSSKKEKSQVRRFFGRHTLKVTIIVISLLGFLLWQFFIGSTKLL